MILDLFAGPGGWHEGLRLIDRHDVVGFEFDEAACSTRAAAGHRTIRADVASYPLEHLPTIEGLIASPPCQDFSVAGKRAGRTGEKGELIDQVPRWVDALRPKWIACEQVPPALVIWEEFGRLFRSWGYSTWWGVLNAANFGVPQTRRRAFLMASLAHDVVPPRPTHARRQAPPLFEEPLLPWVSMAEALGWYGEGVDRPARTLCGDRQPRWLYEDRDGTHGDVVVRTGANSMVTGRTGSRAGDGDVQPYERPISEPAPTLDSKVGGAWSVLHTNRDQRSDGSRQTRSTDQPSPSLTSKAGGQWKFRGGPQENATLRDLDEPASTILASADNGGTAWVLDRPATTVQGDPRIGRPGHKDRDGGESQFAEAAVKITIAEALILQSFRPDYPVQGTKSKQFEQVGNAVPPLLAAHVLVAAIGEAL